MLPIVSTSHILVRCSAFAFMETHSNALVGKRHYNTIYKT